MSIKIFNFEEMESKEFTDICDYLFIKDPFRMWEFPMVMKELGEIDKDKTYLSVGACFCSATYWIGKIAKIYALDPFCSVIDWLETKFTEQWSENVIVYHTEGKVESIKLPDESIDCVIAVSSLEHDWHGGDDIFTSKEIGRVLKKGGKAIITTEYSDRFCLYDKVVGGIIYDKENLIERIINPTGLDFGIEKANFDFNINRSRVKQYLGLMNNFFIPIMISGIKI